MTHTFTMRDINSVEVNLLDQIVSAFDAVLANNRFTFPDYNTTFTLPHGKPSRELRIMFESLKFNVVRISNQTNHGNKLLLDPGAACRQFTYKALTKRFSRDSNTHPTDRNKGGLLLICEFLCFYTDHSTHYLQVLKMEANSLGQLTIQINTIFVSPIISWQV